MLEWSLRTCKVCNFYKGENILKFLDYLHSLEIKVEVTENFIG